MVPQQGQLPSPELLFDTIFKRKKGHGKDHPNKISSMLFYLATIIIHDLFRTSHKDPNISTTSSYLDLSPLYGSDAQEQHRMRTHKDGKIKPDSFSEKRVHGFPPGVSALLIMFNRFHNHVVENLAAINENGRFQKGSRTYDEDLFQVGRLVTCGLYVNIILNDYIRVIVNLTRTNSTWKIDPRKNIRRGPARATGNQVSAEFNLIYRWHATVSERDARWIEKVYFKTFGQSPSDMTVPKMIEKLTQMEKKMASDPAQQPLLNYAGELVPRDKHTKKFDDDEVVKILVESIEDCANAFGANQVPECLRVVEMMSIQQARDWQMCTLNEFRRFFNLDEYKNFGDINPDIAKDLEHLYHSVEQVELYPGIICESTKPKEVPGSGLMPGYTISRAILSDAIALIRSDRFHTTDYHPKLLTNWGYAEADSDPSVDYGCCFYKLFFTSFPQHFVRNSVYAHFPLTVPGEMMTVLKKLGTDMNYSDKKPQRLPGQVEVTTLAGAKYVLENRTTYRVAWREAMAFLLGDLGKNYMLAGEDRPNDNSRKLMHHAMYSPPNWDEEVRSFYDKKTRELIKTKKYSFASLPGENYIDIINDVTNIVNVYFAAEMFMLPLKSKEHPHNPFTEQGMYLIFCAIFICVFFDVDPEASFKVHNQAKDAAKQLSQFLNAHALTVKLGPIVSKGVQYFTQRTESSPLRDYGLELIRRALDENKGMKVEEVVGVHILGTASGMVPNQGQQFAEMLEFYLTDDEGKQHWDDIVRLAREDWSEENEAMLLRYVMEGSRLACGSAVLREVCTNSDHIPGFAGVVDSLSNNKKNKNGSITVHKGDKIFVNLAKASRDAKLFKEPDKVKLDRKMEDYVCFGWGHHKCLGFNMLKISLTTMLRVVASQPHLRPVPGSQGRIKRVPANVGQPPDVAKDYWKFLVDDNHMYFPFPLNMKVIFEDEWDDSRGSVINPAPAPADEDDKASVVSVKTQATVDQTDVEHDNTHIEGHGPNGVNGVHSNDDMRTEVLNGDAHTNGNLSNGRRGKKRKNYSASEGRGPKLRR